MLANLIFRQIKLSLVDYSNFASKLDADYRKHCTENVADLELSAKTLDFPFDIDESLASGPGSNANANGKEKSASEQAAPSWSWKRPFASPRQSKSKSLSFAWADLPDGLDWWFHEKKLRTALEAFRRWNDDLSSVLDLNTMRPESVQRVQKDPNLSYYRGHLERRNVARQYVEIDIGRCLLSAQYCLSW